MKATKGSGHLFVCFSETSDFISWQNVCHCAGEHCAYYCEPLMASIRSPTLPRQGCGLSFLMRLLTLLSKQIKEETIYKNLNCWLCYFVWRLKMFILSVWLKCPLSLVLWGVELLLDIPLQVQFSIVCFNMVLKMTNKYHVCPLFYKVCFKYILSWLCSFIITDKLSAAYFHRLHLLEDMNMVEKLKGRGVRWAADNWMVVIMVGMLLLGQSLACNWITQTTSNW